MTGDFPTGTRRPADGATVNLGAVSGGAYSVADLTRLMVAAQVAKQPEQASGDDVDSAARQVQAVRDIASGRIDTYA